MTKVFNRSIEVVPDYEVIRFININRGSYAAWLGAGASLESGVKTGRQICEELRRELALYAKPPDEEEWARTELSWDDPKRRYSASLQKYGSAAKRVRYFRELIQGLQPAFNHHALTLLMEAGILKKTCLTTNFDKLIEIAFAQQGVSECQAIRGDDESEFWRHEDDKCYVIKLHGDYDTHNILNTSEETVRIPKQLQQIVSSVVKQGGLVVIGSSGSEDSVIRLLNDLIDDEDPSILNMGLYWGVNVGRERQNLPFSEIERRLADKLRNGSVSKDVIEIMDRADKNDRPCAFFPVWGAGEFFFDLVKSTENHAVIGRAARYLDHRMRLKHLFERSGLSSDAVARRLNKLDEKGRERRRNQDLELRSQGVVKIWVATGTRSTTVVEIVYGDITSRSFMGSKQFASARRAVVSPDDDVVSAGGGVALTLLNKAGKHIMLNELSKFPSVDHREVVVTSGGELPVNYVFHAAATKLDSDGNSRVTPDDVTSTVHSAFRMALTLHVTTVFLPLVAAGLEGMKAQHSLDAILAAASAFGREYADYPMQIEIVIREEGTLARNDIGKSLKAVLGSEFSIEKCFE